MCFRRVLASFYYGNLTYPSRDPARVGFLSTVPADADQEMKNAVMSASVNGGNFPGTCR
jgi:phytepsin